MKIFVCIIFVCFFNCFQSLQAKNFAYASSQNQTYYARILDDSTHLYSEPMDTTPIFLIPNTYFVELLNEENEEYYYARYSDVYGYIKKALVKPVKTVPQVPFLNSISFRVFVPSGANLRSSPQNLGAVNLVYSIPFLETNLIYYGEIYGEEAISKKGNVWYYCKYYVNNLSYSGYVYAPLCDCLSTISKNQEVLEYMDQNPIFKKEEISQTTLNQMDGLSQTAQTIIIVAISLPCLLFIYLLFKPSKMAEEYSESRSKKGKRGKKTKKISRLKHSDYFEFDNDDFY